MLNPDEEGEGNEDDDEESEGEMFTKEYFERMEKQGQK